MPEKDEYLFVVPEKTYVFTAYDYENCRECMAISGITNSGEVVWAKCKKEE